jgi:hypothetical protein
MKNFSWKKIVHALLRYMQLQLFITLLSLPFLIAWGIPLSLLVPLGNLIFNPFLSLFLLLSSLVFFSELLCIPNGLVIQCLEIVVKLWHWILSQASSEWLLGLGSPAPIAVAVVIIMTLAILQHQKLGISGKGLLSSSAVLICFFVYLRYIALPKVYVAAIACCDETVLLIRVHDKTILIDQGALGKRLSSSSWVEYTLVPKLLKTCGTSRIDHLILLKPGILLLKTVASLAHCSTLKMVHFVTWQGDPGRSFFKAYGALRRMLDAKGIPFKRLSSHDHYFFLDEDTYLKLTPSQEHLVYTTTTYPQLHATLVIDKKEIPLDFAKDRIDTVLLTH